VPGLSLYSPVGELTLFEEDGAIVALEWGWGGMQEPTPLLRKAKRQLESYFDADPAAFDLPLAPAGGAVQRRIWETLRAIPTGGTRSYGTIARQLETSARAVGAACAANPIPILIPCHRVLGKDGGLVAYSGEGGVETKRRLLRLEGALLDL